MRSFRHIVFVFAVLLAAPATFAQEGTDATRGFEVPPLGSWRLPLRRSARRGRRPQQQPAGPIGVGYTIFTRKPDGSVVRAEPGAALHAEDRFRFLVEPNSDGYLYIFHATDGSNAKMLYPDGRLNGGKNRLMAHRPVEVPSSRDPWFRIEGAPATEQFYIVFSREPLPDVPTGADLVRYCATYDVKTWRPDETIWSSLTSKAADPALEKRNPDAGQKETRAERTALVRDVALDDSAPDPSVWRRSRSTSSAIIVTRVDVPHTD